MLNFLMKLTRVSIGCGVAIALLILLIPLLSRKFSPRWRRWAWFLIALEMILMRAPVFQAPITIPSPVLLSETDYQGAEGYYRDSNLNYYSGVTSGGGYSRRWDPNGNPHISEYTVTIHMPFGTLKIDENYFVRTETIPLGQGEYIVEKTIHYSTIVFVIWLAAASGSFLLTMLRYRRFRDDVMEHSVLATQEDLRELERQKMLLNLCKTKVELRRCSVISAPMLMGFQRKVILLPDSLSPAALETTLAHELTHLKRADSFLLLFCSLARSIHWFNPMAWLMMQHVRQTIEECCDYELLENQSAEVRQSYGRAILDQMTVSQGISSLTTGFSGDKESLIRRFKSIMDLTPKRTGDGLILAAAAMIILSGSLVACEKSAPVSNYSTYTGEIRAMLSVPLEAEDTELSFDPYENELEMYNSDTGLHILPLAEDLKAEDTDFYQIQNGFKHQGRFGEQEPVWYTLVVESGVIREIVPGDWFAIPERDIPTPYYVPLDWTQEFFEAFSVGDYEKMKTFCTEDCTLVEEDEAFWFKTARVLSAEVLPDWSGDGKKTMECLIDGQPAEGSALDGLDGPYILWLYCAEQPDGSWKIDSAATRSMLNAKHIF